MPMAKRGGAWLVAKRPPQDADLPPSSLLSEAQLTRLSDHLMERFAFVYGMNDRYFELVVRIISVLLPSL